MHLAHQVVGGEHSTHTQSEAKGDAHWESFGHRHHDERYRKHYGYQEIVDKVEDFKRRIVVDNKTPHHDERADGVAGIGDEFSEPFELLRERRLHTIVDLSRLKHFAVFGGIAHPLDAQHTAPLAHRGAAEQHIGGIGGFGFCHLGEVGFHCRGFAGERTLIDYERHRVEQCAVGGDFLPCLHKHDVAHHNVSARHLGDGSVAHHLHRDVVVKLAEHLKLLVCAQFEDEAYHRGEHYRHKDAGRLKKHMQPLAEREHLVERDAYREQQRHKEYLDERVVEFLDKLRPHRRLGWRCEQVGSMQSSALLHLRGGESEFLYFNLVHLSNLSIEF